MRRAITIAGELNQIHVVEDLTDVFESIASMKISKIRNHVITSKAFFSQLWQIYRELRINPKERLSRKKQAKNPHNVFLAITSEGKLSGGIDDEIIETLLASITDPKNTEIMMIGTHGLADLKVRGANLTQAFHMPVSDENFNVTNIIDVLNNYQHITVFYQTYESLRIQKVAKIELVSAVKELSEDVKEDTPIADIVSSHDYIFEPTIDEIADYMESVMLGVALIQVIMEAKLAQYASRFNAMNAAHRRATDLSKDYRRQYSRAKRSESDERLKEIMTIVKHHRRGFAR